jgi:hypothetical protein
MTIKSAGLLPLLLLISIPAWSQTAIELEKILNERTVTYGQAASFVLRAADLDIQTEGQGAFDFAAARKWLPKNAVPEGAARLDGISLLIMRAFDLKGGFFYTHVHSPHYAYRELVYKQVIQDRADPAMLVSGEILIFMIGRVLFIKEKAETKALEG